MWNLNPHYMIWGIKERALGNFQMETGCRWNMGRIQWWKRRSGERRKVSHWKGAADKDNVCFQREVV